MNRLFQVFAVLIIMCLFVGCGVNAGANPSIDHENYSISSKDSGAPLQLPEINVTAGDLLYVQAQATANVPVNEYADGTFVIEQISGTATADFGAGNIRAVVLWINLPPIYNKSFAWSGIVRITQGGTFTLQSSMGQTNGRIEAHYQGLSATFLYKQ